MTNDELRAAGPPTKFDNTLGSTFEECTRKFYWWNRGYTYPTRPSYFSWGSAWGIMQGIWHSSPGPHSSPSSKEFVENLIYAKAEGKRFWQESGSVEKPPNDTLDNLLALFDAYVETYQNEPFEIVPGGAEKGWLWPLSGTPYMLGGSIDQYIQWEPFGTLVKEDKTVGGYLTDGYIRQWAFANQVTGYIWYLTQLHGEECFGCLVNMASKTPRGPKSTAKTPRFARSLEKRTEADFAEFEAAWLYRIHRIEDMWERWLWPKTTNQLCCTGGIGKSPCLYQPLCLSQIPFVELDPLQFPGIVLDPKPWAPWEWKDPSKETPAAAAVASDDTPF